MISFLVVFLVVSFISFAGSLQLGFVNLRVIQTVVYHNFSAALWVAFGGCLPELFYASLAVWFAQWIDSIIFFYLEILIIPLFIIWGIYQVNSKPGKAIEVKNESVNLWVGFGLAMMNPQLLPFWLIILIYLNSFGIFELDLLANQIAFVVATSFGAFLLLFLLAWIINQNKNFIHQLQKWNLNKWVGYLIIGLALIQSGYLLQKIWQG